MKCDGIVFLFFLSLYLKYVCFVCVCVYNLKDMRVNIYFSSLDLVIGIVCFCGGKNGKFANNELYSQKLENDKKK